MNGKYVTTLFFIAIAVMKERKLLAENLWVLYLCTDREPKKAFCLLNLFLVVMLQKVKAFLLYKLFTL